MTSARDRLRESPALRGAVERQLAHGLLARVGRDDLAARMPAAPDAPPVDALESFAPDDALEAIVQRVGRPPLLVQNDRVVFGDDDDLSDFPPGTDTHIVATEQWIPSVGRVEFTNFHLAWGGTGWVIAAEGNDRIVATNRHVAGLVARRTVDGRGVFQRDPAQIRYGAAIDFNEEYGATAAQARAFTVVDVPYLADATEPDVAFLRITGADLPSPITLAETDPALDDLVALIGYPAFDDRNDADDMARYFRDLYNVKRYAPGRVIQELGPGSALKHDCTSLGGNSGSPLIRLSDAAVVGLHFAGIYGRYNHAVGASTLKTLLAGRPSIAVPAGAESDTEAAGDGIHTPEDLSDRAGYDPDFLGEGALAAPWPGISDAVAADLVRPSDERAEQPFEIRYTHFGVRHSRRIRQPFQTAVNIDGRHHVSIKRGRDKWYQDGRIPLEVQLGKDDYGHPDIDRGHLVRRVDPSWDDGCVDVHDDADPNETESALAQRANDDTFHYTNSAVQHGALNRSSRMWLGLEDYVLSSAKTHGFRACVFTGPVLRDDDPEIEPGVIAPLEFYKLVVMRDETGEALHATAYVLSQGQMIRDLLESRDRLEAVQGFVLGEYRTFQVSIADLAEATGLDLDHYRGADPLAAGDDEAVGAPRYVPVDAAEQIIL